jgi:hypothetical protein
LSSFTIGAAGNIVPALGRVIPSGLPADGHDYFELVEPLGAADLADWAQASGLGTTIPPDLINSDEDSALFQRRPGAHFI